MALLALLFSIFIAVIGAIGFVSPAKLFHIVRKFQSSAGLYVAAGFRVVFGSALFFAADRSRAPEVMRLVGIIVLVSGLITPLFGLDRFRRILKLVVHASGCLPASLGGVRPGIRSAMRLRRGTLLSILIPRKEQMRSISSLL